jgi:hypothetical protein
MFLNAERMCTLATCDRVASVSPAVKVVGVFSAMARRGWPMLIFSVTGLIRLACARADPGIGLGRDMRLSVVCASAALAQMFAIPLLSIQRRFISISVGPLRPWRRDWMRRVTILFIKMKIKGHQLSKLIASWIGSMAAPIGVAQLPKVVT